MNQPSRKLHKNQILLVDQIISAGTNYLPLVVPIMTKDWQTLGRLLLFQSFFVFFLGISRNAFGTFQLIHSSQNNTFRLLIRGSIFSILGYLISIAFLSPIQINRFLLALIFAFPIVQDIVRFELISRNHHLKALQSDLLWLVVSIVAFFCLHQETSLITRLLTSWGVGAFVGLIWSVAVKIFLDSPESELIQKHKGSIFLWKFGLASMLAELNTIIVNTIIIHSCGTSILGEFRFYQITLLPIALLINLNRILLVPKYVESKFSEIDAILKKEHFFRILIYMGSIIFSIVRSGTGFSTYISIISSIFAIEFAFRRNIKYFQLYIYRKENFVVHNLVEYLALSIVIFFVSAQMKQISILSIALFITEFVILQILNTRLHTEHV